MLYAYLKTAWRAVIKGKIYSVINIAGLAIGLACSLTIGLYIHDDYSYDRFHRHHREIFRVVETQDHEGVLHPVAATPGLLAEALKKDYPEIVESCRISKPLPGILTLNETSIEPQRIIAADNSFFSLFDFALLSGNREKALLGPDEVVITEHVAEQLFGAYLKDDVTLLGQQVMLNNNSPLTIAGVISDCPPNSHLQFDVIVSMRYEQLQRPYNFGNWENHTYHTYLQLDPTTNVPDLAEKIENYLLPFNTWSRPTLQLQPLGDIYLRSHFDYGDWVKTGSLVYLHIFSAVSIVVLIIAIFNFVNLSTARSTQRAKEVGIRQTIGAHRKQLMIQFLVESFLTTSLSVLTALLLVFLFMPALNELSGKAISIPFDLRFGAVIIGLTLMVSLFAGIYPAFLLSSFKPIKALKGFFKIGTGLLFRRALVVTQFSLSVILILAAIVIYSQLRFVQEKEMGFNKEQLVFLRMKNQLINKRTLFKEDLQQETSILAVTATSHDLIDVNASTHSIEWEGQTSPVTVPMSHMIVDADFLSTTGIVLLSGRNIDKDRSSDSTSWLINETAARNMGWSPGSAVGKSLRLWNIPGTVIGVVKDFHFRPLTRKIEPMLLRYWSGDPGNFRGFLIRVKSHQVREAIQAIEQLYKKYESQTLPDYQFVDQTLNSMYQTEQRTARTVLYFSILAILVSCLGLFGLATFSAIQRMKEIGIRKILGASVSSVVSLLSKDFIGLVCLAMLIALPFGWWAMGRWLETFAYHIDVQWWMVGLATGTVAVIAFVTTAFQAVKAAFMNPVRSLRMD